MCIDVLASETSAFVSRFGASISIGCSITSTERIRVAVSWSKNGVMIPLNGTHYSISVTQTDSQTVSSMNISKVG